MEDFEFGLSVQVRRVVRVAERDPVLFKGCHLFVGHMDCDGGGGEHVLDGDRWLAQLEEVHGRAVDVGRLKRAQL